MKEIVLISYLKNRIKVSFNICLVKSIIKGKATLRLENVMIGINLKYQIA